MPSFEHRSAEKELLDQQDIPFHDLQRNLHELDTINRYLGGHRVTRKALYHLLPHIERNREIHITEIGCGGGDNLRVLKNYGERNGYKMVLTGVDINPDCIRYAKDLTQNEGIQFICSDYIKLAFEVSQDIIYSSLFCHHFSNTELVGMMQWMSTHSRVGFFINDLHRHPIAYYTIKMLTRFFSGSYLVRNDAPLSVARGFIKQELTTIAKEAGLKNFSCRWQWAFRWLFIYYC